MMRQQGQMPPGVLMPGGMFAVDAVAPAADGGISDAMIRAAERLAQLVDGAHSSGACAAGAASSRSSAAGSGSGVPPPSRAQDAAAPAVSAGQGGAAPDVRAQAAAAPSSAGASQGVEACQSCGVTAAQMRERGAKLRVCSACLGAAYCSVEHQRADWPRHKRPCKQAQARRQA